MIKCLKEEVDVKGAYCYGQEVESSIESYYRLFRHCFFDFWGTARKYGEIAGSGAAQ